MSRLQTALTIVTLLGCSTDPADTPAEDDGGQQASDAGPECQQPSDCDDGLYCNGEETCDSGRCMGAAAAVCDDGVACTRDVCSEERQECLHLAVDEDGDGRGAATCMDLGGNVLGDDCDDSDANRFPGNIEVCDSDGHDEDCDPTTFGFIDSDGDTVADARCCNGTGAERICGADCDDSRANVNAMASETCDTFDNDCDGTVDEEVSITGFVDEDRDGYGAVGSMQRSCAGVVGFATLGGDCNDAEVTIHPGQLELCDEVDNDCDSAVDEEENIVAWYVDGDGDGYGDATADAVMSCKPLPGHSLLNTDCKDNDAAVSPLAAELCDGVDNDCNGLMDFRIGINDFEDDDEDGFVDLACTPLGTDCDDRDSATGAGSPERCDGRDNDCDGNIDEGAEGRVWFLDTDEDGYGSVSSGTTVSCSPVAGYSRLSGDCDDDDAFLNPSVAEICNGSDDNCNALIDEGAGPPAGCAPSNATGACGAEASCAVLSCNAGFGDCNRLAADGCEADLASSDNCGACFNRCTYPNGAGTCNGGSCELAGCSDQFGNCDDNPSNGCESFLSSSIHCGACNQACRVEDGTACVAGVCISVGCPDGREDCDHDVSNGCETDLDTTANCNECGRICDGTNGTSICTPTGCEITCNPGFGNCNGDPGDGCEASLTSTSDCGRCGMVCGAPNTNYACTVGACEISSCIAPWRDCDGNPSSGCEADTAIDTLHCGGCNTPCMPRNGDGRCNSGVCSIGFCFPGWADCNSGTADGCETNTEFDPNNCGGCGTTCTPMNAVPRCEPGGSCGYESCFAGNEDCDTSVANGCETNVLTDATNCGGCGVTCGFGRQCVDGGCEPIMQLVTGQFWSCVLNRSGNVFCWGDNDQGQLGDGTRTDRQRPVQVERQGGVPLTGVLEITAGREFGCALTVNGVWCWGSNSMGQLGDGTTISRRLRARQVMNLSTDVVHVHAGFDHACAVTAPGLIHCWGDCTDGECGDNRSLPGAPVNPPSPIPVSGVVARDVIAGLGWTCAVLLSGELSCWGKNDLGQLGTGVIGPSTSTPLPFSPGFTNVDQIGAATSHTCFVRNDPAGATAFCWGANPTGQCGNGLTGTNEPTPVPLAATLVSPVGSFAGGGFSCVVDRFGTPFCFGGNGNAQTGTGIIGTPQPFPTPVSLPGSVVMWPTRSSVSQHSIVLLDSDRVFGWGSNDNRELNFNSGSMAVANPVELLGL